MCYTAKENPNTRLFFSVFGNAEAKATRGQGSYLIAKLGPPPAQDSQRNTLSSPQRCSRVFFQEQLLLRG